MEVKIFAWTISMLAVGITAAFSLRVYRKIISPITTYLFPWILMLTLYYAIDLPWRQLTRDDFWLISLSLFSFICGVIPSSVLYKRIMPQGRILDGQDFCLNTPRLKKIIVVLVSLCIVGFLFYVEELFRVGWSSGWNISHLNREFTSGSLRRLGWMGRLMRLSGVVAILTVALWDRLTKKDKRVLGPLTVILVLINFLSPRRSSPLLLTSWIILIYALQRQRQDNKLKLVWLGMIVLLFGVGYFGVVQILLRKVIIYGYGDSMVSSILYTMVVYITGNLDTLLPLINTIHSYSYGLATFYPLGLALSYLMPTLVERLDLSIPFSYATISFNTTPYLYYLFKDFGMFGIVLIPYFLGFFSTSVYTKYLRNRSPIYLILATLMMTMNIYTIRQNTLGDYDLWFWSIIAVAVLAISCKHSTQRTSEGKEIGV